MPELVFIVGAPRSGTTWLQQMLGSHEAVVTSQETDLFDGYLGAWERRWRDQLPSSQEQWREQRYKGLPAVLHAVEFDDLLRGVADRVHEAVLALKPGATTVLEKVPGYALEGALIHRLYPRARFIHLVRDGRDVVASLLRAAQGWGRSWAPSSAAQAAGLWRDHVEGARRIQLLTDDYVEVRYEDLRSEEGPQILLTLLRMCDADADLAQAEAIHSRFSLERNGTAAEQPSSLVWGGEVRARIEHPAEPQGFSGSRRQPLSPHARSVVDRVAGNLLDELGYTDAGSARRGLGSTATRLQRLRRRAGQVLAR